MSVRDLSPSVAKMAESWPLLSDVWGGTKTMRHAGQRYLPKWPGESDAEYGKRLGQAVMFPAFARTCEILASKPFSKPVRLTEVPPLIEELTENIDNAGRGVHAFFFSVMENCLSHGISGVLADFPATTGLRTLKDEREAGVRPFLAHYPAGTVLGFRHKNFQLTQLRLLEFVEEETDTFESKIVEQVRVLYPGRWEIWRKNHDKQEWQIYSSGYTTRPDIPFTFFYGNRVGFGAGVSPLEDLAYLNVEHWQSASDQQTILHVARVPILFMKGFATTEELLIGASTAARSTNKDADMRYVEHSGAAIGAGRQSLLDLEERMRAIGAELLVRKTNRMTAKQVETEEGAGDCMLQAITEMFELGVESCLRDLAVWTGEDGTGIEAEMFSEFSETSLSDAKAQIILLSEQQGVVDKQTAFETFRAAGMLDSELEWDTVSDRMAAQPIQEQTA